MACYTFLEPTGEGRYLSLFVQDEDEGEEYTVRVGDFVELPAPEEEGWGPPGHCLVMRVDKFWEERRGLGRTAKKFAGTWFYKASETRLAVPRVENGHRYNWVPPDFAHPGSQGLDARRLWRAEEEDNEDWGGAEYSVDQLHAENVRKVNVVHRQPGLPVPPLVDEHGKPIDYWFDQQHSRRCCTFEDLYPDDGVQGDGTKPSVPGISGTTLPSSAIPHTPELSPENEDVKEGGKREESTVRRRRELHVLDICCGAGGLSFLAQSDEHVVVKSRWAVDKCIDACASYKINHPNAHVFNMGIDEFLALCEALTELYDKYKDVQATRGTRVAGTSKVVHGVEDVRIRGVSADGESKADSAPWLEFLVNWEGPHNSKGRVLNDVDSEGDESSWDEEDNDADDDDEVASGVADEDSDNELDDDDEVVDEESEYSDPGSDFYNVGVIDLCDTTDDEPSDQEQEDRRSRADRSRGKRKRGQGKAQRQGSNKKPNVNIKQWMTLQELVACQDGAHHLSTYLAACRAQKLFPSRGDVDVLVGGPPCQGVSGHNKFRPTKDILNHPLNRLVKTMIDMVNYFDPGYVLMEQVTAILYLETGLYSKMMTARLVSMRYQTRTGCLLAASFGVSQERPRVFIWGAKSGREQLPSFPVPTHQITKRRVYLPDYCKQFFAIHLMDEEQRDVLKHRHLDGGHGAVDIHRGSGEDEDSSGRLPLQPEVVVRDVLGDLPDITGFRITQRAEYKCAPLTPHQCYLRRAPPALSSSAYTRMKTALKLMEPSFHNCREDLLDVFKKAQMKTKHGVGSGYVKLAEVNNTLDKEALKMWEDHWKEKNDPEGYKVALETREREQERFAMEVGRMIYEDCVNVEEPGAGPGPNTIIGHVNCRLNSCSYYRISKVPIEDVKPKADFRDLPGVVCGANKSCCAGHFHSGMLNPRNYTHGQFRRRGKKGSSSSQEEGDDEEDDDEEQVADREQVEEGEEEDGAGEQGGGGSSPGPGNRMRPDAKGKSAAEASGKQSGSSPKPTRQRVLMEKLGREAEVGSQAGPSNLSSTAGDSGTVPQIKAAKKVSAAGKRKLQSGNNPVCRALRKLGLEGSSPCGLELEGCPSVTHWTPFGSFLVPRSCIAGKSGVQAGFARVSSDELMTTVVCTASIHNRRVSHPTQHRVLSVLELKRCQGFPDYYVVVGLPSERPSVLSHIGCHLHFCGEPTPHSGTTRWGEMNRIISAQMKQVGNAVAPPVALALGQCLLLAARKDPETRGLVTIAVRPPDLVESIHEALRNNLRHGCEIGPAKVPERHSLKGPSEAGPSTPPLPLMPSAVTSTSGAVAGGSGVDGEGKGKGKAGKTQCEDEVGVKGPMMIADASNTDQVDGDGQGDGDGPFSGAGGDIPDVAYEVDQPGVTSTEESDVIDLTNEEEDSSAADVIPGSLPGQPNAQDPSDDVILISHHPSGDASIHRDLQDPSVQIIDDYEGGQDSDKSMAESPVKRGKRKTRTEARASHQDDEQGHGPSRRLCRGMSSLGAPDNVDNASNVNSMAPSTHRSGRVLPKRAAREEAQSRVAKTFQCEAQGKLLVWQ